MRIEIGSIVIGGDIDGFQDCTGVYLAQGEPAATEALRRLAANGIAILPEVICAVILASMYGAQVLVINSEVPSVSVRFLPNTIKPVVQTILAASEFVRLFELGDTAEEWSLAL